jgi:hypothetical protein
MNLIPRDEAAFEHAIGSDNYLLLMLSASSNAKTEISEGVGYRNIALNSSDIIDNW